MVWAVILYRQTDCFALSVTGNLNRISSQWFLHPTLLCPVQSFWGSVWETEPNQKELEETAVRLAYTLVSGPHGPLTRRYAPTSGKPLSGPLRPRTEALSWLKAGMA